ncbi:hypothetical protein GCM10020000_73890 [Streptomyces olivoverticillatus]
MGLVPNFAASRIANRLDLRGPAYTVDAACASSLVAVDHAVAELATGRCDAMLAGGVHHCHDITLWSVFAELRALSPSQRIRPFHRDADGVLMGEGTGVVVLKRLTDAQRDGDRIYAVVRGVGVAGDGRAASLVNPDPGGQSRAVRLAWDAARLDPAAPRRPRPPRSPRHGHAQWGPGRNGHARRRVRAGGARRDRRRHRVGQIDDRTHHARGGRGRPDQGGPRTAPPRAAADAALRRPPIPPSWPPASAPWPPPAPGRRDHSHGGLGVNAFGFGGINAHVVLEEAPAPAAAPGRRARPRPLAVTEPEPLLRLAAGTPHGLAALLDADDATLRRGQQTGTGPARLAIAAPTAKSLALARKAVRRGRPWAGRGDVWFMPSPSSAPAAKAASAARPYFSSPAWRPSSPREPTTSHATSDCPGPARSTRASVTSPDTAPRSSASAGSSRPHWAASASPPTPSRATAWGSGRRWSSEGCSRTPKWTRSSATSTRTPCASPGSPSRRSEHPRHRSRRHCRTSPTQCSPTTTRRTSASPAAPREEIEALTARLRGAGVLGQVLPFESGFHTPMLVPYLDPIRRATLGFTLHPARIPVWSGTQAAPFPRDDEAVRALFLRHLLEPVRFRQLTLALHAAGHRAFVQLGTGQLPALTGDTLDGRDHIAVSANSPGAADSRSWRGRPPPCGRPVPSRTSPRWERPGRAYGST